MKTLIGLAIGLIFLSKISFQKVLPQIPYSFSYFVFQGGLHPYINFLVAGLLSFLGLFALKSAQQQQSPVFRILTFSISVLLLIQGVFQSFFVDGSGGSFSVFASIAGALILILLYGVTLPRLISADEILIRIWKWCFLLSFLSLCLWILGPQVAFKGGRFTGVFKHIPHMVSVGTFCFALSYFYAPGKILKLVGIAMGLFILILTGTRSALAASLMVVVLDLVFSKAKSASQSFRKVTATISTFLILIFFGAQIFGYSFDLARGQKALGDRQAQDGVASRWEEVERGWGYFQEEPLTGYGLAAKFVGSEEADISGYNSFKDPHNLFVSAAVTAGWPGFVISLIVFISLVIAVLQKLVRPQNQAGFVTAVILASHLPILVIYHVHLSVGGIADRLYWILFGILALQALNYKKLKQV